MDRLETYNMTIVSGLVEQECSFANPTNSIIRDVDLRNCFCNGGRINLFDQKCTEVKICCRVRETPYPVPGCLYEDEDVLGFNPEDGVDPAREDMQTYSFIGHEIEEGEEGKEEEIKPPFDKDWVSFDDESFSAAGSYWQAQANGGDDVAASYIDGRFPFKNFFLNCETTFYGQAQSPCAFVGYVNGGFLHANTFDWTISDPREGLCEVILDTQDWESAPYSDDPRYDVSRQKMVADFTNGTLEEWETRYLAYYVRPQPYRLSFTDVIAYNIQIGDQGTYPNAGGIGGIAPSLVDYSDVDEVKWGFGSLTVENAPGVEGGFVGIEKSVDMAGFTLKAINVEIGNGLTIDRQSVLLSTKLKVGDDFSISTASNITVQEFQLGGQMLADTLSTMTINDLRVGGSATLNICTIRCNKAAFEDSFEAIGSTINGDAGTGYTFNDSVSFEGCSLSLQEAHFNDDVNINNTNGSVKEFFAGGAVNVENGSNITVDTWYGDPPVVDETSSVQIGSFG
jgi:hypothetical protein